MAILWSIQRVLAGACYPLLLVVLLSVSVGVVQYDLWMVNLAIFGAFYFILGFPIAATLLIFYWLIEYAHQVGTYHNFYSYVVLCLVAAWLACTLLGGVLIWKERKIKRNSTSREERKSSKNTVRLMVPSMSKNQGASKDKSAIAETTKDLSDCSQPRTELSDFPSKTTRVTLIGIGGMGGNVLNHIITRHKPTCTLLYINTDAQALTNSLVPYTLLIGEPIVRGLGTGRNVATGKEAAAGTIEKVRLYAQDADMVCLIAGLGGGTGSGAIEVYAKYFLDLGKRVVCIVSTPFQFEGKSAELIAQEAMRELDHIGVQKVVLNNQDIFEAAKGRMTFANAFKAADEAIAKKVCDLLEHGQITDDTPLALAIKN